MTKKYYNLVAGLREYTFGGDHKGFDAAVIKAEILQELSKRDVATVKFFYSCYDIENVIALRQGNARFSTLGNIAAEELEEQLKNPTGFPRGIAEIISSYCKPEEEVQDKAMTKEEDQEQDDKEEEEKKQVKEEPEDDGTPPPFERVVNEAYYNGLNKSRGRFLSKWGDFERTLKNICAAIIARKNNLPVAETVIGKGKIVDILNSNPAPDFGLRGENEWIDRLLSIMEIQNLMEREQKIDLLRWDMIEEIFVYDFFNIGRYFNIDRIVCYLIKANIIDRWARLDPAIGSMMFQKLIDELKIPEKESSDADETPPAEEGS